MNASGQLSNRDFRDFCEWNPRVNRPAERSDPWHAYPEWLVGSRGDWRLCASCARLPKFKRFRARKAIE